MFNEVGPIYIYKVIMYLDNIQLTQEYNDIVSLIKFLK